MSIADSITRLQAARAAIAAAILKKGGTVGTGDGYEDFPARIATIPQSVDTSDATAVAADILAGKTAYTADGKVTGTMPNNGAFSDILDYDGSSFLIPAGYHNGSGTATASINFYPYNRITYGQLDMTGGWDGSESVYEYAFSSGSIGFIPDYVLLESMDGQSFSLQRIRAAGQVPTEPALSGGMYLTAYGSTGIEGWCRSNDTDVGNSWSYIAVQL